MRALDLDAIGSEFAATVARAAPAHLQLAQRTLERISPQRWQIEWLLPWWLGEALGLDETRAHQFVLSNVLGLAAIRLSDDLQDSEVASTSEEAASELARSLFDAAFEIYHRSFPLDAAFWARVDELMQTWRAATKSVNQLNLCDVRVLRPVTRKAARQIAGLGAPLKISAHAICELTGRDLSIGLDSCLDHALIATVLYDHALDCQADLRAGRWNLFVGACSNLCQKRPFEMENRARVIHAWMSSDTPRKYFEQVSFFIAQAQDLSRTMGISSLTSYLNQFRLEIWQTHAALENYYQYQLEQATHKLFGTHFHSLHTSKETAH